ncbi:sensor histidine kinase [Chitinophaga japonensis]|uniref:histidine kinase n=1 Tax=Chitinophaga japonensis TaxID=104662 RepID=A0A562SSK7_CHIJA|nr:ATP-binding protein [Chitinophaga japonensis]TWI84259.1 PAS domain S-box-containing protein [Chitinophaga japonensis]
METDKFRDAAFIPVASQPLSGELGERLRALLAVTNNTPDLIYVFDLEYRFTYANAALLTMWGKTWEQAIGRNLLEIGYEPWHAEMHEREIDQVVATRESIRGEVSFPHAVLGKRIYDYIFVPVVNAQGVVEAVAGTTRDITDIRRAEEALQRSREQLEAQVKERTQALHRSNEDLQQFAHVASHDMKEPVRKVLVFANLVKEECQQQLSGKGMRYLDKVLDSARRIYALVDGILSFSSFQAIAPPSGRVDLNDIIRDIESDLEMLIRRKQATIRYEGLPVIDGFPLLISQLFSNLVSNALKFTRETPSPVIRISAQPAPAHEVEAAGLDEGRAYTKIVLQDNGIGFDQQYAERIFQTFSRLHTQGRFEGTGLGLALCRKIVERHGGAIRASGKENEGATFTIILPLQQQPQGADRQVSSLDKMEE